MFARTERLTLRLHEPRDRDALLSYYGDPKVARFLLEGPWDEATTSTKLAERIARRVPAQDEDVANAAVDVRADQRAQFGDAVVDGREMGDRQQRRLLRELTGHADGPVTRRPAGAVGHRHESRS